MNSMDALTQLFEAHRKALALVERIAGADDEETICTLMQTVPSMFEREIDPHLQTEEGVLLAKLIALGQAELVRETMQKHEEVRELARQIAEGNRASLQSFWMNLQSMVRFEEQQVLTVAAALLPECVRPNVVRQ